MSSQEIANGTTFLESGDGMLRAGDGGNRGDGGHVLSLKWSLCSIPNSFSHPFLIALNFSSERYRSFVYHPISYTCDGSFIHWHLLQPAANRDLWCGSSLQQGES